MSPQKNRKRKHGKGRSVNISKIVALLVLFCLCIGGVSMVSAKYMQQTKINNNSIAAKVFYFESDLLSESGKVTEIAATDNTNGQKTASVTVRLKNYADELRYSETKILYDVSVAEQGNSVNQATGVNIQYPDNSKDTESELYIMKAGKKENADVTISGLQAGKTYTVTAETNNIYHKTLTGTIKVNAPENQVYASVNNDENQYIEVTIWTTDYAGSVTLSYGDSGLIPDNTDQKMENALSTGGEIKEENWKTNTSHVFRFFRQDANNKKMYTATVESTSEGKKVTVSEAQE